MDREAWLGYSPGIAEWDTTEPWDTTERLSKLTHI